MLAALSRAKREWEADMQQAMSAAKRVAEAEKAAEVHAAISRQQQLAATGESTAFELDALWASNAPVAFLPMGRKLWVDNLQKYH